MKMNDLMKKTVLFGCAFLCLAAVSCGKKEVPVNVMLAESLTEAQNGNWDKTKLITGKILAKDPENVHALILSAIAMHNTDKLQDAMNSISAAVKLAPANFYAQYLKGYFLYKAGNYKQAAGPLSAAQNLKPDDVNTAVLLAHSHHAMGNMALAARQYKRLAQSSRYKGNPLPLNSLGVLYAKSHPQFASKCFDAAVRCAEGTQVSPLLIYNSAVINEQTGNKAKAVALYRQFLEKCEGNPECLALRDKVTLHLKSL